SSPPSMQRPQMPPQMPPQRPPNMIPKVSSPPPSQETPPAQVKSPHENMKSSGIPDYVTKWSQEYFARKTKGLPAQEMPENVKKWYQENMPAMLEKVK
ncbi:MAG: hypothetical protein KAI63_01085, partial [Planctomycetes bacterium]|nr:hypothetical protein [Planctomycetota bacterium]